MHAEIVICTYQRVDYLSSLLVQLSNQEVPTPWSVSVLVIDNDPGESARAAVANFGRLDMLPVRYAVEPQRGVGNARNRALAESRDCDVLIFFDDDQVPTSGWLSAFLLAHSRDAFAIWSGPVQPNLPRELPAWAGDGWPWSRQMYADGTYLPYCGDGNLLLPRSVLLLPATRYADTFSSGMGQDTEMTRRLVAQGVKIRYVADALAIEHLPEMRLDRNWVLQRTALSAEAWVRILLAESRVKSGRILIAAGRRLVSGVGRVVGGRLLSRPDIELMGRRDLVVGKTFLSSLAQAARR